MFKTDPLPRVGGAFAAANFQLVAIWIFKKHRVIAGAVIHAKFRAFYVFSARFADDIGHCVDGGATIRPKRDAVCVRLMIGFFEAKKLDGLPAFRLKQTPFFAALIHAKADCRQNLRVEFLGGRAISYPKIDVIEKTSAHARDCSFQAAIVESGGTSATPKERRFVIAV
jgi:hypothetical protein